MLYNQNWTLQLSIYKIEAEAESEVFSMKRKSNQNTQVQILASWYSAANQMQITTSLQKEKINLTTTDETRTRVLFAGWTPFDA
jgi:hypothetical protein